jgi:hypothetical protein
LIISAELCRHRHPIGKDIYVDNYIFDSKIYNIFDFKKMEYFAREKIKIFFRLYENHDSQNTLRIYTSGLTQALLCVLNVCRRLDIKVIVLHFNIDIDGYVEQIMY